MEQTHKKRHFSEEEVLEKVEKKIDHTMEKIMKQNFFGTFLNHKIVKNVLSSHFVSYISDAVQPYLKTIFSLIGRVSLVTGIMGIFSFLISLSGLGFMFSLGFGIGLRVLIYVLLRITFSLLSLFIGIGMIRSKKWLVSLMILGLGISALVFLISLIPVGIYSYSSYGSLGGSLFNLIITFVVAALVVKNQSLFSK